MYGDASKQKEERELEFKALLAWIIDRARERDKNYAENIFLFGDLNLDFEEVDVRRRAIEKFIVDLNSRQLRGSPVKVNFPFLDDHPAFGTVLRTNARQDQTTIRLLFLPMTDGFRRRSLICTLAVQLGTASTLGCLILSDYSSTLFPPS